MCAAADGHPNMLSLLSIVLIRHVMLACSEFKASTGVHQPRAVSGQARFLPPYPTLIHALTFGMWHFYPTFSSFSPFSKAISSLNCAFIFVVCIRLPFPPPSLPIIAFPPFPPHSGSFHFHKFPFLCPPPPPLQNFPLQPIKRQFLFKMLFPPFFSICFFFSIIFCSHVFLLSVQMNNKNRPDDEVNSVSKGLPVPFPSSLSMPSTENHSTAHLMPGQQKQTTKRHQKKNSSSSRRQKERSQFSRMPKKQRLSSSPPSPPSLSFHRVINTLSASPPPSIPVAALVDQGGGGQWNMPPVIVGQHHQHNNHLFHHLPHHHAPLLLGQMAKLATNAGTAVGGDGESTAAAAERGEEHSVVHLITRPTQLYYFGGAGTGISADDRAMGNRDGAGQSRSATSASSVQQQVGVGQVCRVKVPTADVFYMSYEDDEGGMGQRPFVEVFFHCSQHWAWCCGVDCCQLDPALLFTGACVLVMLCALLLHCCLRSAFGQRVCARRWLFRVHHRLCHQRQQRKRVIARANAQRRKSTVDASGQAPTATNAAVTPRSSRPMIVVRKPSTTVSSGDADWLSSRQHVQQQQPTKKRGGSVLQRIVRESIRETIGKGHRRLVRTGHQFRAARNGRSVPKIVVTEPSSSCCDGEEEEKEDEGEQGEGEEEGEEEEIGRSRGVRGEGR